MAVLEILNTRGIVCGFCTGRVELSKSIDKLLVCEHDGVFHHANCLAENGSRCALCGKQKMLPLLDWIGTHEREIREGERPIVIS